MKILYICTHNRCRSILCEAITNQLAQKHGLENAIIAKSAGSSPAGEVHPKTLEALNQHGYSTNGLKSQSWDDFEGFAPDVVITVCDTAAGESCPLWFGSAIKQHLGLPDPSKISDTVNSKEAFDVVVKTIETRTAKLLELAKRELSGDALSDALQKLA